MKCFVIVVLYCIKKNVGVCFATNQVTSKCGNDNLYFGEDLEMTETFLYHKCAIVRLCKTLKEINE